MKRSVSRQVFVVCNYLFLGIVAAICILPVIHVVALSFSSAAPASAGFVKLWPIGFTLKTYEYILQRKEFIQSFLVSFKRLFLGVPLNLALIVLTAYPLSKPVGRFRGRNFFAWYFVVTMFISGGIIPLFITVRAMGLLDNIWALILPNGVNVFNTLLMLNYIKNSIRDEIEESAFVDGASYWRSLVQITLPLTVPCLATVTLFVAVGHWNAWFDGLLYMNKIQNYPLQSYLRTVIIELDPSMTQDLDEALFAALSDKTAKACQIVLATIPVMVVYPFLQKYFVTGVTLGGVKQ